MTAWERRAQSVVRYARSLQNAHFALSAAMDTYLADHVCPVAEPEAWWLMSTCNALAWAELVESAAELENAGLELLAVERGERGELLS